MNKQNKKNQFSRVIESNSSSFLQANIKYQISNIRFQISDFKYQTSNQYIRLFLHISALFIFLILIAGCGYHMGSVMHPEVKSIAIAPVINETMEPFVAQYMRQALSEQFVFDASLKVKSLETADCILYARILNVNTTATMSDSYDGEQRYIPSEWRLEITVEFVVIIPGRENALINNRQVIGKSTFQVMADHEVTRRQGIQQACRDAAQQAVVYTTEAW